MLEIVVATMGRPEQAERLTKMAVLLGDRVRLAGPKVWLDLAIAGEFGIDLPVPLRALGFAYSRPIRSERGESVPKDVLTRSTRFLEHVSADPQRLAWDDEGQPVGEPELVRLVEQLVEDDIEWRRGKALVGDDLEDLLPAMQEGIVSISHYPARLYTPDSAQKQVIQTVADAFSTPAWPMLDQYVDHALQATRDSDTPIGDEMSPARSTAAGAIATRLVLETVAFPDLPMEDVLQLRQEFEAELVRLRGEISRISDGISAGYWEPAFAEDVNHAFLAEVAPAVADLRHAIEGSKWRRLLLREFMEPRYGVVAAGMLAAPQLTPAVAAIAAVHGLYRVAGARVESEAVLRAHPMYFLHAAGLL